MTTLIVGCGYLGERLGQRLRRQGERVVGTVRSPDHASAIAAVGIEPVIADVLAPESLGRLPEAEHMFYSVGFDRAAGSSMRRVYVDGLRNVLERLPPTVMRVVYASSTGVYGQTGGEWVDEASPALPPHESGRVCLEAEQLLRNWATSSDRAVTVIVLRFAGLYGPGRMVRRSLLEREEAILGDPLKFLNLIHIDDAAQAAAAALGAVRPESLYVVTDDRPVTRNEYYTRMAELLGTPAPRFALVAADTPEAARDATNKRLSNRCIKSGLNLSLIYPDITTGLPAALQIKS
jgi:nucleoside-diphosphate-sugar epimerase